MKFVQKFQALLQSSKYCKFTVERIFTEKKIEHCMIVHLAIFPVGVSHCYLVQICKVHSFLNLAVQKKLVFFPRIYMAKKKVVCLQTFVGIVKYGIINRA